MLVLLIGWLVGTVLINSQLYLIFIISTNYSNHFSNSSPLIYIPIDILSFISYGVVVGFFNVRFIAEAFIYSTHS